MKKIHLTAVIVSFLICITCLTACSATQEASDEVAENNNKVKVEDGWYLFEDGNFVYAAVIENTSDEILREGQIYVKGLDADGKEVNETLKNTGSHNFGAIYPGEKTAFVMDSFMTYENGSNGWRGTPVEFEYTVKSLTWGETDEPSIVVSESEREVIEVDHYYYDLTLKNLGNKDFDWGKMRDQYKYFKVYEILKDGDGKIIGAFQLYFDEYDDTESYPVIPAGGEVSTEASMIYDYDFDLSKIESRELITTID